MWVKKIINTSLNTLLLAGSLVLSIALCELACRAWRGTEWLLHWPNVAMGESIVRAEGDPANCSQAYDSRLGWANQASLASRECNIDADGTRHMAPAPPEAASQPPILVLGDSFAVGHGVLDDETWPAYLQPLVGQRIINAGVDGYGLDQTTLHAAREVARLKPSLMVVNLIGDDLRRLEYKRTWALQKPYFTLEGDQLVLHNVPAPPRTPFNWAERNLGWSLLIERMVYGLGLYARWGEGDLRATPEGTWRDLACPLVRRLVSLGVPLFIVAQYDLSMWDAGPAYAAEQHDRIETVLACAKEIGVATLDTFPAIDRLMKAGQRDRLYRIWHHSPDGNRLVAELIAAELKARGLPAP